MVAEIFRDRKFFTATLCSQRSLSFLRDLGKAAVISAPACRWFDNAFEL